jgi:hypothetical protein
MAPSTCVCHHTGFPIPVDRNDHASGLANTIQAVSIKKILVNPNIKMSHFAMTETHTACSECVKIAMIAEFGNK